MCTRNWIKWVPSLLNCQQTFGHLHQRLVVRRGFSAKLPKSKKERFVFSHLWFLPFQPTTKGNKPKEATKEKAKAIEEKSKQQKAKETKRRSETTKGKTKKKSRLDASKANSRRSPRLQRTKSSSGVTLEELMEWELIGMRDEIHYEGEV